MSRSVQTLDDVRRSVSATLDPEKRAKFGQFMTPTVIADYMSGLFKTWPNHVELLDPGAGIGSLSEAFAREFFSRAQAGSLKITAYEIDVLLSEYLREHLEALVEKSKKQNHKVVYEILKQDFLHGGTFYQSCGHRIFTHAILNPPYKKVGSNSSHRFLLRSIGIETVNLYTAFLAVAVGLMRDGGEIVAIIPRSFCNGPYYRPFREWLLALVSIEHIHVFESRNKAFKEDDVLQENIIVHLVRGGEQGNVTVTTSYDSSFSDLKSRSVAFESIVKPNDVERFIYIPTVELQQAPRLFEYTLAELGMSVSTGPVVDFRLKSYWLPEPNADSVPLLYAHHFAGGEFRWPRPHKKPNALSPDKEVSKWLMPRGWYVVTKRFSAKEEKRRVVAHVVDPNLLPDCDVGFENHLNVIHISKRGLKPEIARGLAVFLNSTVLDQYFRSFSGHTQVNATDLRSMKFPSLALLAKFGKWAAKQNQPSQEGIDRLMEASNA